MLRTDDTWFAVLVLVIYVSFGIYGFMSLFFESPFLSPLYWVALSIMHHYGSRTPPVSDPTASRRVLGGD